MVLVESRASPPGWILRLRLGQARHSPYDSSHDHNTRIVLQAKLGRALPGLDGTRASVPPRPQDGAPTWASVPPSFYKIFTSALHLKVSLCKNRWNPSGVPGSAPTHLEKICRNALTIRAQSSKIPGVIQPRFPRRNNMIVPALRNLFLAA